MDVDTDSTLQKKTSMNGRMVPVESTFSDLKHTGWVLKLCSSRLRPGPRARIIQLLESGWVQNETAGSFSWSGLDMN